MIENQKMRFWGTSGGEGIPAPFCRCRVCEYAREHGGKDVRMRSSFRIDDQVFIDAGDDFVAQTMRYREDIFDLEHILYTHVHHDHCDDYLYWYRMVVKGAEKPTHKLHMYFAPGGAEKMRKGLERFKHDARCNPDVVELHELEFYKTTQVGKYKVTPLKGHHTTNYEEHSANYLIEFPNGKKMYYAVDSGIYVEETFEYLKNIKLDLLIGECTFMTETEYPGGHMNLYMEKLTLDRLWAQGTIDKDSIIYLTHICGVLKTHDELVQYWKELDVPYDVKVAYDGLSIAEEAKVF